MTRMEQEMNYRSDVVSEKKSALQYQLTKMSEKVDEESKSNRFT